MEYMANIFTTHYCIVVDAFSRYIYQAEFKTWINRLPCFTQEWSPKSEELVGDESLIFILSFVDPLPKTKPPGTTETDRDS
jgi:hypothetical protein